jgi:selenocysteine-specific elongation factor
MHVIGTAGHVDHGKSTLVKALTGIDPDRLKEEQQRQMTIDLGFAWLRLPSGKEVGIVDVPGHRDFIENMLAGMPGIDLALLVIALDECVMPQTREHLAILDLLAVKNGIIVLTKSDLVSDKQWVDMVKTDVKKLVTGTVLDQAPMVSVSARTGAGIAGLIQLIDDQIRILPDRLDHSAPRMSIDRVFTLTGFGTVVTGSLLDGHLNIGDEIEVLPSRLHARIRGLQTHKHKQEFALPGNRTAINLSGLQVDQLHRGEVIVHPGIYQPSSMLDANFRMLADAPVPLRHRDEVKLFIGSAEINAHVRILAAEEIQPGTRGFLQLELDTPTLAVRGDRFILRRPSPPQTLGGGEVLDEHPKRHSRRSSPEILEDLHSMRTGSDDDGLLRILQKENLQSVTQLISISRMPVEEVKNLVNQWILTKKVVNLSEGNQKNLQESDFLIAEKRLDEVIGKVRSVFDEYYRKNPLRLGMKKEELNGKLTYSQKEFDFLLAFLVEQNILILKGSMVCLIDRKIKFSSTQAKSIRELLAKIDLSPYAPPLAEECIRQVGGDVYQSFLDQQILIQISPEVVFRSEVYHQMQQEIKSQLEANETITLAQVRDLFHTSRKYALAVLEHLDRTGLTVREGDYRKLKKSS